MKALYLRFNDGTSTISCIREDDFDTQKWAESRKESFKLLEVIAVEEHYIDTSTTNKEELTL